MQKTVERERNGEEEIRRLLGETLSVPTAKRHNCTGTSHKSARARPRQVGAAN